MLSWGIFPQISATAQAVELGPFIGQESLPGDDDLICVIPTYPDIDSELEGMVEGSLIPDFRLYTLDNTAYTASEFLEDGKPALLISCSYTCPVFREKIPDINELQVLFGDEINIFLIYTVEAHPKTDISPYFGEVNTGADNYEDGILYRQPGTYGARKEIVQDMLSDVDIDVTVLIDGPCNEWWEKFGTNPNCSWLVTPDGIVYDAEVWFDRYPDDIKEEIANLLGEEPGGGGGDADGYFVAMADSEDCFEGIAGETITGEITVTNEDDIDTYIDILKLNETLPDAWETSICTDICYPPSVDSANLFIAAGESVTLHYYFYTNDVAGEGTADIILRNHYHPENNYVISVKACASEPTAVTYENTGSFQLFPNPAQDFIALQFSEILHVERDISIMDLSGRNIYHELMSAGTSNVTIDVSEFPSGVYFLSSGTFEKTETLKFSIQK